jgi:thiamine biosynthesis lipoprotein
MAMPVRITVWSADRKSAETAIKLAFRRIAELDRVFSDFDSNSESRQLTKNGFNTNVNVGDDLWSVLSFSKWMYRKSGGGFDPAVGQLTRLWHQARRDGKLPAPADLRRASRCSGFDKIHLDCSDHLVRLTAADLRLDFGGIAKGYIGDKVIEMLSDHGILIACYEAGGDIVVGDPPPGTDGWSIDVGTGEVLSVANCGLSISGDSVQFVDIGGERYSHIIDPRTGIALTNKRTATVIAPTGMLSDALATTGCVLEPEEFEKLLRKFTNVRGWSRSGVED